MVQFVEMVAVVQPINSIVNIRDTTGLLKLRLLVKLLSTITLLLMFLQVKGSRRIGDWSTSNCVVAGFVATGTGETKAQMALTTTVVKAALEANAELIISAELKPTVVRQNQIA